MTISSKIFVGNLNFDTTADQLSELLGAAGEIKDVYLPTDRVTGRPRGFAFVEFAEQAQAEEAIEKFNEHEFAGRKLRINAAESRPPRRPSMGGPSFGGGGDFGGGGNFGPDRFRDRPAKPKGSRRGMRGKKRSL